MGSHPAQEFIQALHPGVDGGERVALGILRILIERVQPLREAFTVCLYRTRSVGSKRFAVGSGTSTISSSEFNIGRHRSLASGRMTFLKLYVVT